MLRIIVIILTTMFITNICFSKEEYFLTLRYDDVNLRQGPSSEHPIKIKYKKRFLPVLVQDKFDNYRKIRDHENNTGWIHISQLSKKKAAIIIENEQILFHKPTIYSKPIAIFKKGRLARIIKCKENWCKAQSSKYKGWLKTDGLWGLFRTYIF